MAAALGKEHCLCVIAQNTEYIVHPIMNYMETIHTTITTMLMIIILLMHVQITKSQYQQITVPTQYFYSLVEFMYSVFIACQTIEVPHGKFFRTIESKTHL